MSLLPALAPWQQRAYEQACAALDAGHFGHATLVVGPALLGKRVLAEHLARRVLCLAPRGDGEACGTCRSCALFASRSQFDPVETRPDGSPSHPWGHSAHPDLLLLGHEINRNTGKPRSEIVMVFFFSSSRTSMRSSPSSPFASPTFARVLSFWVASTALEMSSRIKIS